MHRVFLVQWLSGSFQVSSHCPGPSWWPLESYTSARTDNFSPTLKLLFVGISEIRSLPVAAGPISAVVVVLPPPFSECWITDQLTPPAITTTLARASGFCREPGIDGNLTGPASIPLPTI